MYLIIMETGIFSFKMFKGVFKTCRTRSRNIPENLQLHPELLIRDISEWD